ncbi:MAG: hypothetical protein V3V62_11745 [bacterium]
MSRYAVNKLVHEIQFPEKRERYRADEAAFLAGYDLTEEELAAVQSADIRTLWEMGVNPYLLRVFQLWNRISDADFTAALEGCAFLDPAGGGRDNG